MISRRTFLGVLAAGLWAVRTAEANQASGPVIGFLSTRSPEDSAVLVEAFRRGLREQELVEGKDVTIEYRWARGRYDRLPALAAELVRRPVAVLVAVGGESAAMAAKAATATIPIVFSVGVDPVKAGLVESYARPGGNATGVNNLTPTLEAKRLDLLHELVPQASTVGILVDPVPFSAQQQVQDAEAAARTLGLRLRILRASTDREIDTAFAVVTSERLPALLVTAAPFFDTRRTKLLDLAARHRVPAMYHFREFTEAGGLMSYGIDPRDTYRQVGVYAGRILKGARPADLPVFEPTKFPLVINLRSAKALGLTIPSSVLARVDEVIE